MFHFAFFKVNSLFGQKKEKHAIAAISFFFFFGIFSFDCCSNGCFSSIHNVKDLSGRNGFFSLHEQEGVGTLMAGQVDWLEFTGSIVSPCLPVSLIGDQQRTPFHHGWFLSPWSPAVWI